MASKIKRYVLTALAALPAAALLYFVYVQVSGSSHGEVRKATANTIDIALESSPVVVIGKVTDDKGTPRNLRRDSVDPAKEDRNVIVPGTDYDVEVIQVLKGNVEPNSKIKVAVPGGSYQGKTARLQATLKKDEAYIFALAPSSSGPANYYGLIEPYIFQLKNNKVVAVTNDDQIKANFREEPMTEADLIRKFNQ